MADRLAVGLSGIADQGRDAPAPARLSPSRMGLLARSDPWAGKGEGVNTRSPLCRTKPSGQGVAPGTAIATRSATAERAAWPQDVGSAANGGLPPCESPGSRNVNRPPRRLHIAVRRQPAAIGRTDGHVARVHPPGEERDQSPDSDWRKHPGRASFQACRSCSPSSKGIE